MSIIEWGILAEIVASICVVITLLFLTYQVRQGNREALITSTDSAIENYVKSLNSLQYPEQNAAIVRKGLNDYLALSPVEQAQLSALLLGMASTYLRVSDLYKAGLLPDEEFNATESNTARILKTPGGYAWWQMTKSMYPPRSVERIDHAIEVKYKDTDSIFSNWKFFAESKNDEMGLTAEDAEGAER